MRSLAVSNVVVALVEGSADIVFRLFGDADAVLERAPPPMLDVRLAIGVECPSMRFLVDDCGVAAPEDCWSTTTFAPRLLMFDCFGRDGLTLERVGLPETPSDEPRALMDDVVGFPDGCPADLRSVLL